MIVPLGMRDNAREETQSQENSGLTRWKRLVAPTHETGLS